MPHCRRDPGGTRARALVDQPGRSPRPGCAVKNFILSGAGVATRMTAGAGARLVIVFPPQHIGEERSRRNSGPSDQPPLGGGVVVPAWRGVLSAPRRLEIDFPAGTQVPITIEGLLAAYVATGRGRQGGAQRRINTILKLTLPATPGQELRLRLRETDDRRGHADGSAAPQRICRHDCAAARIGNRCDT